MPTEFVPARALSPARYPPALSSLLATALDAACKQHLGKLGSKADLRTALANDLLVLLCGVRVALLWDYWVLDGVDADEDGWSSGGGGALSLSQVLSFLYELRQSSMEAGVLQVICIGASVFIVHADALRAKLERGPSAELVDMDLVAVNAQLQAPRLCSVDERRHVCAGLAEVSAALLEASSRRHPVSGPADLLVRLPCPRPASLMVAVHGWLLGYPAIYCHAAGAAEGEAASDGSAAGNATCLGDQTLAVCAVTTRRRAARDGARFRVCSFSLPAGLADDCAPQSRPSVRAWWEGFQARFASAPGCTFWEEPRLEVQARLGTGVTL